MIEKNKSSLRDEDCQAGRNSQGAYSGAVTERQVIRIAVCAAAAIARNAIPDKNSTAELVREAPRR